MVMKVMTYYEMIISYVGTKGCDFIINKMAAATGNVLETLANGTAEFAGTGMMVTSPETERKELGQHHTEEWVKLLEAQGNWQRSFCDTKKSCII